MPRKHFYRACLACRTIAMTAGDVSRMNFEGVLAF